MTDKEPTPAPAKDPVKRWTLIVLILCGLLVGCYLRADRVTPSTTQARVHALVIPIAAEVSGTVTSVFVKNNQAVKKGEKLFQVELDNYQLALESARATLEQARQAQGAAKANVDAARAKLESTRSNEERARLDAERMRNIREQDPGAISQRRLESAESSFTSAQASVTAAQAGLVAAIEQLGEEGDRNAAIRQAQAALDTAQLNLDRATITAPEDGVVTGVRLDTGNFAGAGQPQLTFIARHNIWIQADYKENNLGHLDPGDEVGIVFDVYPGRVIKGKVREVGFGVSLNDPPLGQLPTIKNDNAWLRSAQRYPVLVDFDLPGELATPPRLKVGSQATVVVYTGDHAVFNFLARVYLRLASWLTFAW